MAGPDGTTSPARRTVVVESEASASANHHHAFSDVF
jgi:hypothetical protein